MIPIHDYGEPTASYKSQTPRPSDLVPGLPVGLDEVVACGMAKSPVSNAR